MKRPDPDLTEITDAALARFLRKLAVHYSEPPVGSASLGRALSMLASDVAARATERATPAKSKNLRQPRRTPNEIARLEPAEVKSLLEDAELTKAELLQIATFRFSIPTSALERQPIAEVREKIRSAMMHEASISLLSSEARRQGDQRKS